MLFNTINICVITDDADGASVAVSKYRKPKLNEVYKLLKGKASHWSDIGRELGISFDARESIRIERYPSDRERLEKVLSEWLSSTDQSLVMWEEFIRVLTDELNYMDIVDQTNTFLQNI